MKFPHGPVTLLLASLLVGGCGGADDADHTLVLNNGTVLRGELHSRSENGFRFVVEGDLREFPESEVHSLTLMEGAPPLFLASAAPAPEPEPEPAPVVAPRPVPAPAPPRAAAPPPAPSPTPPVAKAPPPEPMLRTVTVARGTRLMVTLDGAVSTKSHKAGAPISGTLDRPLTVDGTVIAPKGSKVYGRVLESAGGRRVRSQRIVLEFDELTVGDDLLPISTDRVGAEGGGGSGVKTVGAGALIGAAFGGSSGAGKGAAVGAGLSLLGGGEHITVPAGSLIEVHLTAPLRIDL